MANVSWHRPIREGVVRALDAIFNQGRHADTIVHFALKENKKWGSRDRRLFAEAVYDITRWYRKIWEMSGGEWPRHDDPPAASPEQFRRLLDLWSETGSDLANLKTGKGRATDEAIPNWLDALGEKELGSAWDFLLPELNRIAPVFLRANFLKADASLVQRRLEAEGFELEILPNVEGALRLKARGNVFKSKTFADGLFEVQDLNSQKIVSFLSIESGQRVIDACAGAGGKTLQIASLLRNKGKIIAMDVSERKLEELKKRARRAGVSVIETRCIDSTKIVKRLEGVADRLLLDVPCSGLGALRRNPDSKWKMKAGDVMELRERQENILTNYSSMAKSGTIMIYATCSILPSENERQVEKFLSQNGSRWLLEHQETFLPERDGGDGFFVARLRCLKEGNSEI